MVAENIIADVRKRGDRALVDYTKQFDGVHLRRDGFWISKREIAAALKTRQSRFLHAIQHAARNVRRVAEKQPPNPWSLKIESGVTISQLVRPIDSIGCYDPGGNYALVSTMLMTVVPAQVAA